MSKTHLEKEGITAFFEEMRVDPSYWIVNYKAAVIEIVWSFIKNKYHWGLPWWHSG